MAALNCPIQKGDIVRAQLQPEYTWTVESVDNDCISLIRFDEIGQPIRGASTIGGLVVVREAAS